MKKQVKPTQPKKVKKMTIDDLAVMVAKSFETMPTRGEMNARFDEMRVEFNSRFDEAAKENKDQFARIEYLLIRALDNRTERLEDDVRILKTTVARLLQKL